eukprot:gnl/Hemi2/7883_TR2728_c0_g1_i2.p1 gnl/Hemi2/7883_TR2728_c0_g1~~gnl/Hemi2/7883_TR2728_c0_g1_i2.p1  ORF type:complete len:527 (-),score=122.60 gnl/Hemi2/7883_TR2728_c0_g1_i2:5-1585(-)
MITKYQSSVLVLVLVLLVAAASALAQLDFADNQPPGRNQRWTQGNGTFPMGCWADVPQNTSADLMKQAQCQVGRPIQCPMCQCFIDWVLDQLDGTVGSMVGRVAIQDHFMSLDCLDFGRKPYQDVCIDMTGVYRQVVVNGIMDQKAPFEICHQLGYCAAGIPDPPTTSFLEYDLHEPSFQGWITATQGGMDNWNKLPIEQRESMLHSRQSMVKAAEAAQYVARLQGLKSDLEGAQGTLQAGRQAMKARLINSLRCPTCRCLSYFAADVALSTLGSGVEGRGGWPVENVTRVVEKLCDQLVQSPFYELCHSQVQTFMTSMSTYIHDGMKPELICRELGMCVGGEKYNATLEASYEKTREAERNPWTGSTSPPKPQGAVSQWGVPAIGSLEDNEESDEHMQSRDDFLFNNEEKSAAFKASYQCMLPPMPQMPTLPTGLPDWKAALAASPFNLGFDFELPYPPDMPDPPDWSLPDPPTFPPAGNGDFDLFEKIHSTFSDFRRLGVRRVVSIKTRRGKKKKKKKKKKTLR